MSKYKNLNSNRYSFQDKFSKEDAVVYVVDYINNSLDKGDKRIGIFLDLAKAFDTMDHKMLLSKLNRLGISGITLNLCKLYLTDGYNSTDRDCTK